MLANNTVFGYWVILIYAVTTLLYGRQFFSSKVQSHKYITIFLALSLVSHGVLLFSNESFPQFSKGGAILICSAMVGLSYLLSEVVTGVRQLGFFTMLPISVGIFFGVINLQNPFDATLEPMLATHILMSLSSYACFSVAIILAVMFLFQFKNLKKKNFEVSFKKLPPLNKLERLITIWNLIGFSVLIIAVLLAWKLYGGNAGGVNVNLIIIHGLVLGYGLLLVLRKTAAVNGIRYVYSNIGLYAVLIFSHLLSIHGS